jgi:hypothetical protein
VDPTTAGSVIGGAVVVLVEVDEVVAGASVVLVVLVVVGAVVVVGASVVLVVVVLVVVGTMPCPSTVAATATVAGRMIRWARARLGANAWIWRSGRVASTRSW